MPMPFTENESFFVNPVDTVYPLLILSAYSLLMEINCYNIKFLLICLDSSILKRIRMGLHFTKCD